MVDPRQWFEGCASCITSKRHRTALWSNHSCVMQELFGSGIKSFRKMKWFQASPLARVLFLLIPDCVQSCGKFMKAKLKPIFQGLKFPQQSNRRFTSFQNERNADVFPALPKCVCFFFLFYCIHFCWLELFASGNVSTWNQDWDDIFGRKYGSYGVCVMWWQKWK